MYYEDELYDDDHCVCGERFDWAGNCPACDGSYDDWEWEDFDEYEGEETE